METAKFTQRRKDTFRVKCCVQGCGAKSSDKLDVRFHKFPTPKSRCVKRENLFGEKESIDIFVAWKLAVKISNVTSKTYVCSSHFRKSDYLFPDIPSVKTTLKKNAVPSCNLPTDNKTERNTLRNSKRLERRLRRERTQNTVIQSEKKEQHKDDPSQVDDSSRYQDTSVGEIMQILEDSNDIPLVHVQSNNDVEVQTDESSLSQSSEENKSASKMKSPTPKCTQCCFVDSITTDAELSTATGIESFSILNIIVQLVKNVYGNRFEGENMKLKTRSRVIIVFTKFKQNLSYSLLAIMFRVYTAMHIQRIFEEMVKILSSVMKPLVQWQSREQVRSNLPKCFEGFEDTRVVLDCTEIRIQSPKEVCCQILTYSHYKSHVTAKFMTGVSPSGTITYISRVYGGRVSDSNIFEQSDLTRLLEPGDAVMVDRGFLIDEICEMNRWKCIRPPFLKDKNQFSKEESLLTSKIASARVHVERSNQRIKTFQIVGSLLPGHLVVLLEDIFTVICATINMSSPIIKDDKFMQDN